MTSRWTVVLGIMIGGVGCHATTNAAVKTEQPTAAGPSKASAADETTPKVVGVGGVFFFTKDPKTTTDWYVKNLGLEANEWGATFEMRNLHRPEVIDSLQWTAKKEGDEYFAPSTKDFMINYRVQNIEGLVAKLRANGVTLLDDIATYDYGKFVHIMDEDGNKIELWEPSSSASQ